MTSVSNDPAAPATAPQFALRVDGLKKSFDKNVALAGVSFDVPLGSIFGLLGPNGAGKTTLFSLAAGFLSADDGTIDLSNAYLRRIGEYDDLSITWLYQDFPEGTDEAAALREIAEQGMDRGLYYMGHTNNNFRGAGHQYAGVWDNGDNLVDHLKVEIEVIATC